MNRSTIVTGTVALCAAGCLFLNAALAQDQDRTNPAQQRTQPAQDRMTSGQNEGREVLKQLEGQWRVTVEFQSGTGAPRGTTPPGQREDQPGQPRPGQSSPTTTQSSSTNRFDGVATRRWVLDGVALHEELRISSGPGASPARFREEQSDDNRPGMPGGSQQGQQQSQSMHEQQVKAIISRTLQQESSLSSTQADTEAGKIVAKIKSGGYNETNLESTLKECLVDANLSEEDATRVASTLAPQVQPHLDAMKRDSGQGDQTDPTQPQNPQYRPASGQSPDFSNFQGLGLFTYDMENKTYNHVWVDNQKGCAKLHEGEYDAGTKTFTFRSSDASSSGEEFTLKITDPNTHVIEMSVTEDGQPMNYTVTYTKAGASQQPGIRDRETTPPDRGTGSPPDRGTGSDPNRPARTLSATQTQQIESLISKTLQEAGLPQDTVVKHTRELREDIAEDYSEGDLGNLEQKIADALNDAGLESGRATTVANRLAADIRTLLGG